MPPTEVPGSDPKCDSAAAAIGADLDSGAVRLRIANVKTTLLDGNPPQKDVVAIGALPDTSGTGNSVLVNLRAAGGSPETSVTTSAANPAVVVR